ncbi:glucuronate isomerase [Paenibacillus sinopodophylli]|uniref:glucuronate isomerase n=1 Tax=Paenibacillus sinopodophylli TaxID=1837342 RepID=UPI003CCC7CB6
MEKVFMDEDFVLENPIAHTLYHEYAKHMPIIDYHCHLNPQEMYENKKYRNITEVWLSGDHYKWRLMRANGIEEQLITGDASDYDKFLAFAETVPLMIGNPMYHWTHLELKRYFGINEILNRNTAPMIWEKVNKLLTEGSLGARDFIVKSNVQVICTTDDPTDTLEYHVLIQQDPTFDVKVLPTFRPDKGLDIKGNHFLEWISKLERASGIAVSDYDSLLQALENRVDFFHSVGCRVSDHGLNDIHFVGGTKDEVSAVFAKVLAGGEINPNEEKLYKTALLVYLGNLYSARGWAMQYHMNVLRNNNTPAFKRLGPDAGYDSVNDGAIARPLSQLLDAIESEGGLPKTILYSLNPAQNQVIGSMIGNFQGGGIAGKMQFGSGWWFNDTKEGMIVQLKSLAELGLLGRFVGMLTDSRSFLSFTRHEYFRRILCNLLGEWVTKGEYPNDKEQLGEIVQQICYYNAEKYFSFE